MLHRGAEDRSGRVLVVSRHPAEETPGGRGQPAGNYCVHDLAFAQLSDDFDAFEFDRRVFARCHSVEQPSLLPCDDAIVMQLHHRLVRSTVWSG